MNNAEIFKTKHLIKCLFIVLVLVVIPLKSFALDSGLIKSTTSPTIYYLSNDGHRYTFPSHEIFSSWYQDFRTVKTISPDLLKNYPIGGSINIKTDGSATDPSLSATKILDLNTPSPKVVEQVIKEEKPPVEKPIIIKKNITPIIKDSTPLITTYTSFISFTDKLDTKQKRANAQLVLNKFMTPSPDLVVDGSIGKKTVEAVKIFQTSMGLISDGKIGPITRKALEDVQNKKEVCSPSDLFNSITGESCNSKFLPGCTSYTGFSSLTGKSCVRSGGHSGDPSKKIKPIITSFTTPESSISFNISIYTFTATDNYAVIGYLITETPTVPNISSDLWSLTPPTTYHFFGSGTHTLYAWAKDADGNVSIPATNSVYIIPPYININSPTYDSVQPTNNVELNFTASGDPSLCWYNLGGKILDYNIQNNIPSNPNDPTDDQYQYPLENCHSKTITLPNDDYVLNLYAKHESGNWNFTSVLFRVDTNSPLDTIPPIITSFTLPETSNSLTVSATSFIATDEVGVTGYLITEEQISPTPESAFWEFNSQVASYTFSDYGTYTLYAWAKDAAGNVSLSASDSIEVTPLGDVMGASTYKFTQKLQLGSSGNEVKELQKILISKGYLKIKTPTGTFGPMTEKAVKAYQKDKNLTTDGIIGSGTRSILNQ